jgi:hypothetical protein
MADSMVGVEAHTIRYLAGNGDKYMKVVKPASPAQWCLFTLTPPSETKHKAAEVRDAMTTMMPSLGLSERRDSRYYGGTFLVRLECDTAVSAEIARQVS